MTDTTAIESAVGAAPEAAQAAEAAGQETIDNASPEARRVALLLGTLFKRMLSYGAGTSSILEAGALGLSFLEFKAIMSLGVFTERDEFCLADISESTGGSAPAVSRAIDSLVRKGLVTRVEDPDDRRRRLIALTDEGHKVTDAALLGRAVGAVKLADSFSEDELAELDALLTRLIEREDLAAIHQQLEGVIST